MYSFGIIVVSWLWLCAYEHLKSYCKTEKERHLFKVGYPLIAITTSVFSWISIVALVALIVYVKIKKDDFRNL